MNAPSPRHFALVVPTLRGGGAQRVMAVLAGALAGRGYRVDLLVCQPQGPVRALVPESVRLIALRPGWRGRLAALSADPGGVGALLRPVLLPLRADGVIACLPSLADYLRRERPEVLLSAKVYANLGALLARRLARVETAIVASEHGAFAAKIKRTRRWRWRHVVPLIRRLYAEADAVVAVSESLADAFAATTGFPRERVRAVHNPVISREMLARAQTPVAHPWFSDGGPAVILAVGHLRERKGFTVLLRAFARVRARRAARLVILGEGRQRPRLESLARSLGIAGDVDLPGFADNPLAYMARASVFALSSTYEGLPGVLIEALACGCPVVATDCPTGPAEILAGGRYGRLVPVGDHAAMADAICATLDDPPERSRLRARGLEFSVERAVERYLALFAELTRPVAKEAALKRARPRVAPGSGAG